MDRNAITTMRRRVGGKVGRMDIEQCQAWLERYSAEGVTAIGHETVRELTGGYCTQSISGDVKRKVWDRLRKLQRA
jgi:hypothetical protein